MEKYLKTPESGSLRMYYDNLMTSDQCDVTIKCSDGDLMAIGALLIHASDYFKLARRQDNICHTKLTFKQMCVVVKYIYTRHVEMLPINDTKDIIIEARIMLLNDLASEYEKHLVSLLTSQNVNDFILYGYSNKLDILYEGCISYICALSSRGPHQCADLRSNANRYCCLHEFEITSKLQPKCLTNDSSYRKYCCGHKDPRSLPSIIAIPREQMVSLPSEILCEIISRLVTLK